VFYGEGQSLFDVAGSVNLKTIAEPGAHALWGDVLTH
jgi:hypothetical protein